MIGFTDDGQIVRIDEATEAQKIEIAQKAEREAENAAKRAIATKKIRGFVKATGVPVPPDATEVAIMMAQLTAKLGK